MPTKTDFKGQTDEFLVDLGFSQEQSITDYTRKERLKTNIETPYGNVVAFTLRQRNPDSKYSECTMVPWFYLDELPKDGGMRKILVGIIPEEHKLDISNILRKHGYVEPINFW